jgi:hypothetical protein
MPSSGISDAVQSPLPMSSARALATSPRTCDADGGCNSPIISEVLELGRSDALFLEQDGNVVDHGINYAGILRYQGFAQFAFHGVSADIQGFTLCNGVVEFLQPASGQARQGRFADRAAEDFEQFAVNGHVTFQDLNAGVL